ncbi:unnamed protein product (macronuclear) [Paramecium tetraurelia]|uniref:Dynein heavy chain linker domain-containing protein n=1 Tax=Paramecium tetraurelia TaxID=5888 RepID=A0BYC6_PARTE|nr:uncharacterized protein GSPATT00033396001 [Paramecium tetraurelia]CAK63543.1 unnamed protein product [Paramecium tetraurelia]|eukprot:XP_001430941.1 hypothetical protein (macronuclear) [Paramecium tetraurelia strain d4-2]
MQNPQEKIDPLFQFEFIFNSELSQNIDSVYQQNLEGFKCQSILYNQEIMICDLMLLLEDGKLKNDKLSISGYFKLMDLIQDFVQIQTQQNQFSLLNYCVIKYKDGKLLVESKIKFDIHYPSLTNQIDELQAKFSQFVDQTTTQGQELEEIIRKASLIYSQYNSPITKNQINNKNNQVFYYIQNRFFMKQYLINQSIEEQNKSLQYFQQILAIIQSQPNCQQILDKLIEVDFTTLEQIQQFVKQQEFQHSELCIMDDFELNKYYIVHLQTAKSLQQKIKEKNAYAEYQKQEDKKKFIQNQLNDIKATQQSHPNFLKSFFNQLKLKFWVLLDVPYQEQNEYYHKEIKTLEVDLKSQIHQITKQYSESIKLKYENKHQLEKLVKIIVNHNDIGKIIGKIFEFKIKLIHQYVQASLTFNKNEFEKNLDELYEVNKKIYLPQLQNHPSIKQQVDIILDYCERIKIMIQNKYQNVEVDFKQKEQMNTLLKLLESINYQNTDLQDKQEKELYELTNRFCPNLCISKSSRFQIFKNRIEQKISKQKLWTKITSKQKSEIKAVEFQNQYQFPISNFMENSQNLDQLMCAIYANNTWNSLRNSLQVELQKQIELDQYAEQKEKIYKQYQDRIFIPIEKFDVIFKIHFEQQNEKKIMEEIDQFFDKKRQEEGQILRDLQEFVELTDEFIKSLDQEKNDYFQQQFVNKPEYKSIEEMQDDVQKLIQDFRQLKFQKYYDFKSLIETIHKEYIHQCQYVFINSPSNFKRFKLEKQNKEDKDIKKKIIEFYGSQLLENLKLQL